MSAYLIKMTPLEPFTFGGEKGFRFDGRDTASGNNAATTSYYQTSKEVPEQTTVIGMLRYIILKQAGVVKKFSEYTPEDRKNIAGLIGKKSFSFQDDDFNMGVLKSVSPVFIVNQEKEQEKMSYFVRNPLNNLGKDAYRPIRMQEQKVHTSNGMIRLPVVDKETGYTTKTNLNYGYLNLGTASEPRAEFVDCMFQSDILTGNKKNDKSGDEDGFFKRQTVRFYNKNYAFAVFVECEDDALPEVTIATMGLKKSAFLVECIPSVRNDLEERISKALSGKDIWYYAVSDVLTDMDKFDTFSIVFKKQMRNMETDLEGKHFAGAVKRSKKQYNLIEAGSVFYDKNPIQIQSENLKKAGYNCIVKIGGAE